MLSNLVIQETAENPLNSLREKLSAPIRSAPHSPGVYLFRNSAGQVLYIGKALSLRKRLCFYLTSSAWKDPRRRLWLAQVNHVEWQTTLSELEALLLEARWIKQLYPWFNRALRYYRHQNAWPFLRVNLRDPFPVFTFVEEIEEDGAQYYGPFLSSLRLRQVLKALSDAWGLCTCGTPELYSKEKPCFRSQIGRCLLPCKSEEEQKAYWRGVVRICDWLEGRTAPLVEALIRERDRSSENLQFERAGRLQRTLEQVQLLQKHPHPLHLALNHLNGLVFQPSPPVILLLKWGRLRGQWPVEPPITDKERLAKQILQVWTSGTESSFRRISPTLLEEIQIIESWLTHRAKNYPCLMTTHPSLRQIQQWLKNL